MSKDDLLNKNANSLAAAIFSYHKTDPGKEDEIKLLSTMKAVTAVATVQYLANKEDVENSLINGEQLELSFATIETKNGAADLSIKTSSEYKDMVDIEYNGVPEFLFWNIRMHKMRCRTDSVLLIWKTFIFFMKRVKERR